MKKRKKNIKQNIKHRYLEIFIRYSILLVLGFLSFQFYKILQPITFYSIFGILKPFYSIEIIDIFLAIDKTYFIEIIPSCVAASAYLLLIALNLSIPMNKKQRIYSLTFSILSFFILNLLRIIILTVLFVNEYILFESIHEFSWYVLSTIFVVVIWLLSVKIFKIKSIPIYSDILFLKS